MTTSQQPKKLSVAFVWHMHQPVYKDRLTGDYLMPWVRLHAVKDYLDMVLMLEEFPNIKQTFNIVPALIDQLNDYAHNEAHDIHSKLTVSDIANLSTEDKVSILNYFFDANYANMILPHEPYKQLYEKRHQQEKANIDDFSDQEFSDIMAWFNIVWFDPRWINSIPELKQLHDKGINYTLEDRIRIIEIQREIIKQIIPKYKEFFEKGKIEISTSPYYHPVLPLLVDLDSAKEAIPDVQMPDIHSKLAIDAKNQLIKGIDKFKEVFGQAPNGIWPSEHSVNPQVLGLMSELGIKWTITDEGILAKSIGKEFLRDFRGILEDPYDLCRCYQLKTETDKISIVFRNSVLSDMISFEYCNHDPEIAANDLYERIKTMQGKLQMSPEKNHIVAIALDGENSWENYTDDAIPFLRKLYGLLNDDTSIDVTTISQFLSKSKKHATLDTIHSGSWINRNFQLWIGDPTKNMAWDHLNNTRQDLLKFSQEENYPEEILAKAWEEIYIAEGSDWFWWYGEPNDSGQDDLFDYLFRMHLQNVYKILGKPTPQYLEIPLEVFLGKPSKTPIGLYTPKFNGKSTNDEEWQTAGCIEIPQSPTYQPDKLIRRIYFCNDYNNIYFRFDINEIYLKESRNSLVTNGIYIYFSVPDDSLKTSPIRLKSKGSKIFETQKNPYSFEVEIQINNGVVLPPMLSQSIDNNLWKVKIPNSLFYEYKNVLELGIPFKDLNTKRREEVDFVITTSKLGTLQEIVPQNKVLSISRP